MSQPSHSTLDQAIKLQDEARRLILSGCAAVPSNSANDLEVANWALERQRLAEREPANAVDCLILLHFAAQALEVIPVSIETGAIEEARLLVAEVSAAITSLETFLIKSTGKTPSDFGLLPHYFPEALH